ncbi:hypothetical protein M5K25_015593 [Dendrobium thyrsiflorum]|uniref:Uncharacterized protein n=1 Tax=Dendrobium thyrsiflorum TaxID=117978 RepID=A0ABD0UXK6_DENTH
MKADSHIYRIHNNQTEDLLVGSLSSKPTSQVMERECWTMERPIELIHSSFSFSESAMKYIVSRWVESSKANCRLITSSAPLTVRHVATGMMPRGTEERLTTGSLNQNSFPCFRTNQRRLHVLMYSPCFVSHPPRSGFDQNSTPSARASGSVDDPITALQKLAIANLSGATPAMLLALRLS